MNNKQDLVSAAIVDMMEIVEESGRMDFRFLALLGYLEDHVPEIAVETSAEPLDHDPEDLAEYDAGESPWDDDFLAESDGGGLFDENDPLPF